MSLKLISSGGQFAQLSVVRYVGQLKGHSVYLCLCSCGRETNVTGSNLRSGKSKSCGCYRAKRMGEESVTHGGSGTQEYNIYCKMVSRCENPEDAAYENYGGRGVRISQSWGSFSQFLKDMGVRPSAAHSIERRDNDGHYSKDNCYWATASQQARNRRSNVLVSVDGVSMVLKDACAVVGLPYKTVHARLANGWTVEKALATPVADRGQGRF